MVSPLGADQFRGRDRQNHADQKLLFGSEHSLSDSPHQILTFRRPKSSKSRCHHVNAVETCTRNRLGLDLGRNTSLFQTVFQRLGEPFNVSRYLHPSHAFSSLTRSRNSFASAIVAVCGEYRTNIVHSPQVLLRERSSDPFRPWSAAWTR